MITNEKEMNDKFRSFSLLEEEKKSSAQKIEKNTKPSTSICDQDLIVTDNNGDDVKTEVLSSFRIST